MDFTDKADLLMYGSAYPHWSTTDSDAAVEGLSREKREKVLWRNAVDLYGIGAKEGSLT